MVGVKIGGYWCGMLFRAVSRVDVVMVVNYGLNAIANIACQYHLHGLAIGVSRRPLSNKIVSGYAYHKKCILCRHGYCEEFEILVH